MWVLIQHTKDNSKIKYLTSRDYNVIISYINSFSDVKKYNDYLFISRNDIYFEIRLGEELFYEKASKKKEFIKEVNKNSNKK